MTSAMKKPTSSPERTGLPQKTGRCAPGAMSFEIGTVICALLWSGPGWLYEPEPEVEGNRGPGQYQRRRKQQGLLKVVAGVHPRQAVDPGKEPVQPGPVEDPSRRRERVVARRARRDHDPADEQGEDGGDQ